MQMILDILKNMNNFSIEGIYTFILKTFSVKYYFIFQKVEQKGPELYYINNQLDT